MNLENKNMITIIVVESKTKAKILQKILGYCFKVISCNGHIADLPKTRMGYDEQTFEPSYVLSSSGKEFIKDIKEIIGKHNVKEIMLCTDPDREGEFIAQQIQNYVSKFFSSEFSRIVLKEMSEKALKEAIKHGGSINNFLVESQKARRVLDRMIGYKISNSLYKKLYFPISAGRVQTPALNLIYEKFIDNMSFSPKTFYKTVAISKNQTADVSFKSKKFFNDENTIPKIVLDFDISKFDSEERMIQKKCPLPLDTVGMQRKAYTCFGFSAKRTMSVAQTLFEGKNIKGEMVGLITYVRTDSKRMSKTFFEQVAMFLKENYSFDEVHQPEIFKEEDKYIQDAHECIRPTDINLSPNIIQEYLTDDEFKLYSLVYFISLCSCMSDAYIKNEEYRFVQKDKAAEFSFYKQSIIKNGFLTISEIAKILNIKLLDFDVKENIVFENRKVVERGPALYNENTLIVKLNDLGIGRPSTYASICPLLMGRNYVNKDDTALYPTALGKFIVTEMSHFNDFFNLGFTSDMEKRLDEICNGKASRFDFLQECNNKIIKYLSCYTERIKNVPSFKVLNNSCFVCGSDYTFRLGRFGPYAVCDNNHKHSLIEDILNFFFFSPVASVSLKVMNKKKLFKTTVIDDEKHNMFYDGKMLFCKLCKIKRESDIPFIYHM